MMNDKGNMMKSKVTFLSAKDGSIEITYRTADGSHKTVVANTTKDVTTYAGFLDFSEAYCSSSMDFADEYGFAFPSEAWSMLERGLNLA